MNIDYGKPDESRSAYLEKILSLSADLDRERLSKAYIFAWNAHSAQYRKSGEPYISHPASVSIICAEQGMGTTGVVSALLHDTVEDTRITKEDIAAEFGDSVARIVDGVTKLTSVHEENRHFRKVETYRKILLNAAEDIRVIIIKFADRLHNLRTLNYMSPEKKKRIARETLDIYAPLALRLGMGLMKSELEDLSFKHYNPVKYQEIVDKVSAGETRRKELIQEFRDRLNADIAQSGITAEVFGRSKSYYSIYKKNINRNVPFNEIFDLLAMRVVCSTTAECYQILGVVHSLWTPVPYKLKDYIAAPKSNGYQSIHTTVAGKGGNIIEIQIRTWEMNHRAEEGVAAHWRYKDSNIGDSTALRWLRNLVSWQKELSDSTEFYEFFKIDIKHRDITVQTPKNEKIVLPKGATVIDFAFAVHTDIGLHCIGAKVNGHIEKPDKEIRNGDVVEVLHSFDRKPNIEWLNDVKTPRARSEIKRWLRKVERRDRVSIGKQLLFSEYSRLRLDRDLPDFFPDIFRTFSLKNEEELFEQVAQRSDLSRRIVDYIGNRVGETRAVLEKTGADSSGEQDSITIGSFDSTMIRFASCCHPIPGDSIVGFVTRGRGVSVHRCDCPTASLFKKDPMRAVSLRWDEGEKREKRYVRIKINAEYDRALLRHIVAVFDQFKLDITHLSFSTKGSYTHAEVTLAVHNTDILLDLKRTLRKISGITSVARHILTEEAV